MLSYFIYHPNNNMTNIMHIKPPIYEILLTPSFMSFSHAHISESALHVTI
jgi:hypothetical protein